MPRLLFKRRSITVCMPLWANAPEKLLTRCEFPTICQPSLFFVQKLFFFYLFIQVCFQLWFQYLTLDFLWIFDHIIVKHRRSVCCSDLMKTSRYHITVYLLTLIPFMSAFIETSPLFHFAIINPSPVVLATSNLRPLAIFINSRLFVRSEPVSLSHLMNHLSPSLQVKLLSLPLPCL